MGTLKLGQLLITRGLLHPDHLSAALADQQDEVGARLGMILVRRGFVEEEALIRTLAGQLKLPVARIRGKQVGPEVIEFVPADLAEKHRCLPLFFKQEGSGRVLFVAMEDPSDAEALAEISQASGHDVRAVLVGPTELEEAIQRHYHWTATSGESPEWSPAGPGEGDGEAPHEAEAGALEVEPLGADPAGEPDPLSAADGELEPDFDTNWRADADEGSEAIAAPDPDPLWTGQLGAAVTTPDLGAEELEADLEADLEVEPDSEAADAESDLDFDPQFQLDLPELPPARLATPRPETLDPGIILRALSQLLVEKGVISREEFVERLSQLAAREGAE